MTPIDSPQSLSGDAMAALRHELRTPVNHIMGYAEMLLEDAPEGQHHARRQALQETLDAARSVLGLIGQTLPSTRDQVSAAEVAALYASLRQPQTQIVQATRRILDSDDATADPALSDDLQRILRAARQLAPEATSTEGGDGIETGTEVESGTADRPSLAHILVVDDVEDNREVLRRRLVRDGHRVSMAANGREALEHVRTQAFDLVLLDVLMPELDGYDTLNQIKADPATRDVPVIMISALDDLASVVRCIESGAEDYLPKPFDPVLLRARIRASLEKKRLRDVEVAYLDRVKHVIEAAGAIEAGTYEPGSLADMASTSDELGQLARVVDGMAIKIRERERRLKDRVRDLRLEIEAARATPRAVEALVDGGNLKTGARFADRYEVLEMVGSGGMGSVYRARDTELDEEIAIKTLRPQLVADGTVIERFKQEIRLARRLTHPNIVRTHDFGNWRGVYYLTMEYVEGITVRELIDTRGQLGISSTLVIGSQLAAALHVAHEQGIIHRDIKPQNLLLDEDGILKIMDFGIARLAERTSTLTEAGLVVGTPSYMSPEQLLSEAVDARSDLFAVGVVIYECLTGTLPFQAESPVALIAKLLNEEPLAPTALNDEIPPAMSALVLQLLEKKPESRLQAASQLEQRLREMS